MKERISRRVRDMRYSVIRAMSQMAAGLPDVITLGIGEPDFGTPEAVTRRALDDALAGHTHYTHSQGDPELLAALARHIALETGLPIGPHRVIVTHGGMGALACSLRALLEEGDGVVLPEPHFPDYLAHIAFAGGQVSYAPTLPEDGFVVDPDAVRAAIKPNSKVLLLNSPCNPTGAVIPGPVLDRLAQVALEADLLVISDEVYDGLTYGVEHESIATRPGMAERTLVVKSFSKLCAMTGWRVGYAFGPRWMIEEILKVVNYTTACASSVGQRAALAALDEMQRRPEPFTAMHEAFEERVDYLCTRLENIPGVRLVRPKGAFYVFADLRELTHDSHRFAVALLQREQVVVVPGYAFGPSGEGCVRLAATVPQGRLAQAMDRFERFVADWRAGNVPEDAA